jgi:DNA-binding CsgD family transcriptional regulator
LFQQLGRPQIEYISLTYLVLSLSLGGRPVEATEALAALDKLGPLPGLYVGVDPLQARAWAEVATGSLPQARRLLHEAATKGEAIGDRIGAVAALHGLARLGEARSVLSRIEAVAADVEGELTHLRLRHTRALARGDARELADLSVEFESLGCDLLAAEASADAAVAWWRAKEPRNARAAERRAAALADLCEGAVTPSLQALDAQVHLTPAEREASRLAASGRSNKDIAKELYLSVRTVETYLQRAYNKLGVANRAELSEVINESSRTDGGKRNRL